MPKQTFTEAERQERREADRRRTREAVEALRGSDGWQQWLRLRHRFHTYRLENLALLCPNCHSQTASWGGPNRRRGAVGAPTVPDRPLNPARSSRRIAP